MTLIQALEIVVGLAEIGDDEKEPDQIEALELVAKFIEKEKFMKGVDDLLSGKYSDD